MNGKLERMWKETIMAYFMILSQNFPERAGKNYKEP
jgi:hypothetical protein